MKLMSKFQVFEKLTDIHLIPENSESASQFKTRAVRAASDHQGR